MVVAKQHRKVERMSYCGRTFVISLEVGGVSCSDHTHSERKGWSAAMLEMMCSKCDFPPKAHHLARWSVHYSTHQSWFIIIMTLDPT